MTSYIKKCTFASQNKCYASDRLFLIKLSKSTKKSAKTYQNILKTEKKCERFFGVFFWTLSELF